jgi:hypothetical protein
MGQESQALKQFIASEAVAEEQFREYWRSFSNLREVLQELLKRDMSSPSPQKNSQILWLKYFGVDGEVSSKA